MTTLVDLKVGEKGQITGFSAEDSLVQRLLEMGLLDGEIVEVLRFALLGDPIEIRVCNYNLSLRRSEAAAVQVERV